MGPRPWAGGAARGRAPGQALEDPHSPPVCARHIPIALASVIRVTPGEV
ncbi:hypothetical protein SGM_0295 [Streptomyces griseoaurantiacus M045]|uniref:Uncharacterized protein n=1 Tax=Streptomyces griseoaurantiacus M045 TaxID=996637 RepID=F3NAB1_9ACTN|nr:hypothetical protein SGM_0295 [Streptomyces griseoaurantiacus M045]